MPSSGMLRRVGLARTDVSEESIASIMEERIGEIGTALAVTSNGSTLRRNQLLVTVNAVPSSLLLLNLDHGCDTFLRNVGS
jgi:hypothetical protein